MLDWLKEILGDNYSEEIDKKVSAKIEHLYSAYFLHNRFSKTSFILVYANQILTQKNIVGTGLPPAQVASGVQSERQWLSPNGEKKECNIASDYLCNVAF